MSAHLAQENLHSGLGRFLTANFFHMAMTGTLASALDGPAIALAPSATVLLRSCLSRPPVEARHALSLLALGSGLIVSSFTTKYRDLTMLVGFGVQLLMYATPIAYPFFTIKYYSVFYKLLLANPLTGIIEACKFAFTSNGMLSMNLILADAACILLTLFLGVYIFSKVEKRFMDTV